MICVAKRGEGSRDIYRLRTTFRYNSDALGREQRGEDDFRSHTSGQIPATSQAAPTSTNVKQVVQLCASALELASCCPGRYTYALHTRSTAIYGGSIAKRPSNDVDARSARASAVCLCVCLWTLECKIYALLYGVVCQKRATFVMKGDPPPLA